jgi:hypothetical protein
VKPSGPGALSGGRALITDQTSSSVNHDPMLDRSKHGRSRCSNLMCMSELAGWLAHCRRVVEGHDFSFFNGQGMAIIL